ncbi:MAG: hypothetical protein FD168_1128 [Desulfobulbaceae bacterium]|nr:MAG: hypothetical protein FD168_1128 [Desulfobulbaceae bacterium]
MKAKASEQRRDWTIRTAKEAVQEERADHEYHVNLEASHCLKNWCAEWSNDQSR